MKKFSVNGLSASGTANKTAATLISATTTRALLSEVEYGVRTNPNATDQQVNFQTGSWATSAGTAGSSPVSKPLDLVDPIVGLVLCGITHSGEPTYDTTFYIDSDMSQRGLYRWVAEIGFELAATAAATKGIGTKMAAVTAAVQISSPHHWKE